MTDINSEQLEMSFADQEKAVQISPELLKMSCVIKRG